MLHKAIFLEKDGTLVENVADNMDPAQVRLVDGAVEALRLWHAAGYSLIVVSNQSGVARGLFSEADLQPVQARLSELLAEAGVPLAGFYFCPHLPQGNVRHYAKECFCRKPRPGMLFQAGREHDLNLESSWMVGNILDDVEAGRRAGCGTVLLDNGGETEWQMLSTLRQPHRRVSSLPAAAHSILEGQTATAAPAPEAARPAETTRARGRRAPAANPTAA